MNNPKHKIIFEGAELSGKSWLMSQIYNTLEPKYNSGGQILDGCHWFNSDIGLYGTKEGAKVLDKYLELMEVLKDRNVMVEKFHLSEAVYQKLYNNKDFDLAKTEERLKKLSAKIILITFPEDEELIAKRLEDRLNIYPHYKRIAQRPADYIKQQQLYVEFLKQSKLDSLIIKTTTLPDQKLVDEILVFLGEK